jgi:formamidopyrimidine-DNA glycosylase
LVEVVPVPELPEAEAARLMLERALLNRRITRVEVAPDRKVFDRQPPEEIAQALQDRTVVGSGRKGKYFWLQLDRRPWPVFHLGMSGSLRAYQVGAEPPPHCKIEITTEEDTVLAMRDPRRFGRIRLAQDPLCEPPISKLGFDCLLEPPTTDRLLELLRRRKGPIKGALLDQSFSAGVGNWIADEVLYQAGISPTRPGNQLTRDEVERLRATLQQVIEAAVAVEANKSRFPADWLFHQRWGRTRDPSIGGSSIVRETIAGRTTAWVPERQS